MSLIAYVGCQQPIRAGRVALAVICWQSDFEAYRTRGKAITGHTYVRAAMPGEVRAPRNLLSAFLKGLKLGGIEYRLRRAEATVADARWLANEWREGVPV